MGTLKEQRAAAAQGRGGERGSVMTSDVINQLDGVLQESGFSSH